MLAATATLIPKPPVVKKARTMTCIEEAVGSRTTAVAMNTRNKRFVHDVMRRIADADQSAVRSLLKEAYAPDAEFRGSHPFNEMSGPEAIYRNYWGPLHAAFPDLERRDDLVIGGNYEGNDIVGCVGHLVGTFTGPWLGLPPTGKTMFLRYGEYHKMAADGRISQSTVILDVLDAVQQTGFDPIGWTHGAAGRWSMPYTADGVLTHDTDPEEGDSTIGYILEMHKALMGFKGLTTEELLSNDNPQKIFWHPKMMWYGPAGIGSCRGLEGFVRHHQMPFRKGFPTRIYGNDLRKAGFGGGHYVRIGDGKFAGTGGWPSVVATHDGPGWLGLEPTGRQVKMRVMDFYALDEGTIRENWVPMDMCHILLQLGVDVLELARAHFADPAAALSPSPAADAAVVATDVVAEEETATKGAAA